MSKDFWEEIEYWSNYHDDLEKMLRYRRDETCFFAIDESDNFKMLEKIKLNKDIRFDELLIYQEILKYLNLQYDNKAYYTLEKLKEKQLGVMILLARRIKDETQDELKNQLIYYNSDNPNLANKNLAVVIVRDILFESKLDRYRENLKDIKEMLDEMNVIQYEIRIQ